MFRRLFVVKIGVLDTLDALYGQTVPITQQGAGPLAVALLTPLAALLAWRERSAVLGLALLAACRAAGMALTMPYTINHMLLELVLLVGFAIAAAAPPGPTRRAESVATARWAQVIFLSVWFYAGVQKVVHGAYLTGELFGLEAFADDRGMTLGLSGAVGLMMQVGSGLFGGEVPHVSAATLTDRVDLALAGWMAPFLIGLSTMIVVVELGLPLLFFVPRARRAAVVGLGLVQIGIALSSMELDFAVDNLLFLILLWPGAAQPEPEARPRAGARRFRDWSAALLLLWPPVHMALSLALPFSSWRLFGWGMYASPDLWRFPDVYQEAQDHRLTPIVPPKGDPALARAYKPLHYFPSEARVGHFAQVAAAAAGQPDDGPLVVVVSTPRLDLSLPALYTDAQVFRVQGEQVQALGGFSTRDAGFEPSVAALVTGGR